MAVILSWSQCVQICNNIYNECYYLLKAVTNCQKYKFKNCQQLYRRLQQHNLNKYVYVEIFQNNILAVMFPDICQHCVSTGLAPAVPDQQ